MTKITQSIVKYLSLSILIITVITATVLSQDIVLKPENHILPYYSLEEWIYNNANWSYDSYDLNSIEAFSPNFSSTLENEPALYINGDRYLTSWLTNGTFTFPEISFEQIDSIIVQPYRKITNGEFTASGSIQIFLKEFPTGALYGATYINQVNDPGPQARSKFSSPNVEYLSKKKVIVFSLPDILGTTFSHNLDWFSRTNTLDYNQNTNKQLFDRTKFFEPSGNLVFQRNKETNFLLLNTLENSLFTLNLTSALTSKSQYYEWHPLSGIEVPASHKTFQTSANFKTVEKGFYKNTQLNYSYSSADTLEFQEIDKPKFNLIEQQVHQTSTFGFENKDDRVNIYLNNIFYNWEDIVTGNSKSLLNNSINIDYLSEKYGSLSLLLGNYNVGFEYRKQLSNNYSLNVSTFRSNLESSGYNYTFWNEGIGFSNLNPSIHSVLNSSSFTNIYSTAKISSHISTNKYQLAWNIYPVHYWQFVHTNIDYDIISGSQQLGSEITYSDVQNVGFVGFFSSLNLNLIHKTSLRSSISGRLHTYGSNEYLENSKGINNFIFMQSLIYKAHRNAFYELSFRYISPREIHEYESLKASSSSYTSRVRPIKMLNASFKTWLIDRSLLVTLSLRNMLNSTESYNTNGQYYNMSIHFSAVLHIGKK
ncbi:MAG: hypothetical protein RLN90_01785 [Balneolaceae bacterium]